GRPPPFRLKIPVMEAAGIRSGITLLPERMYGKLIPYWPRGSESIPSTPIYGSSCARSAAPDMVKSLNLFAEMVGVTEKAPSLRGRYERVLERSRPVPKVPSNGWSSRYV